MTRPDACAATEEEGEDIATLPLEDLLALIGLKEEDRGSAERALERLIELWGDRVQGIARQMTTCGLPRYVGWETLASEIWCKIWEEADGFDAAGRIGKDVERRFFCWVKAMAHNRVRDLVRRECPMPLGELTDEVEDAGERSQGLGIFERPQDGSPAAKAEAALFAMLPAETLDAIECIRSLSPKRMEVLRRSAPFLKVGQREVEFPRDGEQRDQIIHELRTTLEGFRALRTRAFKDVEQCMHHKARKRGGAS